MSTAGKTSNVRSRGSAATPASFVRAICLAYTKYGVDPSAALQKAQIPPEALTEPAARVTSAQFEALSWIAMQELDDEALGWFSRKLPWGAYGMLCRASLTSPTLEVALRRWIRHHRILVDDIVLTLTTTNGVARLAVEERRDLGPFREFCLVTVLRYALGYACWLTDHRIRPTLAEFPYPAPDHRDVYPKLFAEDLRFEAAQAAIQFDAADLERPPRRDEQAIQKMLKRALPLTVLPYRRDQKLSTRVQQVMNLPNARLPAADDLADGFNISTRTLHRHLSKEGASLRALKKRAWIERAKTALSRTDQPVKRVAHLAGFQSEKSFSRAFKQATGETPRAFRRMARDGTPP